MRLNDINSQITGINTALNNITSSHKAKNDSPKISSSHDIDQIKFLREELKNKNIIANILLENIFSNNKDFSSYKKLEDNYKNNVEKIDLKLPKDTHLKIAIKLRTMKTQMIKLKTDMKISVTQMKVIPTNVITIMTDYLIMSRQAYHHGK